MDGVDHVSVGTEPTPDNLAALALVLLSACAPPRPAPPHCGPGRPLLLGLTRSQPRIARAYFVQSPAKEWCICLAAAKGARKSVGSWCRSGHFSSRKAPRQQDNDNSRQSWRHSGPPRRAAATVFPLQARCPLPCASVQAAAYRAASGTSLPIHAQQARILKRVQGAQVPLRAFAPGQVQDCVSSPQSGFVGPACTVTNAAGLQSADRREWHPWIVN